MRGAALCLLLVALAAGCGPAVSRSPEPETPAPQVWPQPPARARIRFVRSVARPEDLGVRPSMWQRLGQIIAGKHEEWMVRPTAAVARGPIIYVADPGAQALWMIDLEHGRFRKTFKAAEQPLVSPVGLAVGGDGRVYLVDSFLAKVFVYDADLEFRSVIADSAFRRPAGLAFDLAVDRLYVADSAAHRVWIYTGDGTRVGAIGRRGSGAGEFNFPTHVAVGRGGTIYVTDSLGFRVETFEREGRFAGSFGRHGDSSGDFASPKGVAVDSQGHVYVVESLFDAVQIFDGRGRFLLSFGERGVGLGKFWLPVGVFIDREDRIYVADAYNQRIQIFQYLAGAGDDE